VTSLFAWGAGAWLAAGLGTVQLSVRPRVDLAAVRWTREWLGVGAYFTATTAIFAAGSLGVAVIIAANIGNVGVGLFRTVQTMFGPVQLLTIGGASVFLPYLVRGIKSGADGTRESQRYSLLMTVFVTIYGVALLVTAHTLLTNVFGPTFDAAAVLVLPMLVAFALDTVASGAGLLLRARALGGRLLVAQLIGTVARIAGVAVLVSVGGLRGAGWGLAIGSGITMKTVWVGAPQPNIFGFRNVRQGDATGTRGRPSSSPGMIRFGLRDRYRQPPAMLSLAATVKTPPARSTARMKTT